MNRKQRRANKQKSHDPAYMVKQSEMRSHIDRLLQSEEVQQAIKEEANRVYIKEAKKQDVDIITLILMSLHRSKERMGRIRLLRFCHTFNELQKYYEGRYDDCDMFAMRKHLKEEVGIDVERINEEVEKFLNENPNERQT